MSTIMTQPLAQAQPSALPTTAEIIAHDLSRLVTDERLLRQIVSVCATLQRYARLSTVSQIIAAQLGPLGHALRLTEAATRHLQHQARLEHLEICDSCGRADGVTSAYREDIGQWWHECPSCSRGQVPV